MTTMLNSKSNSILIRKIKTYSVTVTSSQSQHANVMLQCHCDILHTDFRNNSLWSVSYDVRHTTSSCSQNLCRCTKQSLDHCRTWQSGIALSEKNENTWQTSNK